MNEVAPLKCSCIVDIDDGSFLSAMGVTLLLGLSSPAMYFPKAGDRVMVIFEASEARGG